MRLCHVRPSPAVKRLEKSPVSETEPNTGSKGSKARQAQSTKGLNVRTALLGLFVVLTVVFGSTTVYESGVRNTLASTSTSTTTSTFTATVVSTSVSTSVSTITMNPVVDPTTALKDAYLSHISAIEMENAMVLATQYETNATLVYATQLAGPTTGSYGSIPDITRFYEIGGPLKGDPMAAPFAVANATYSATMSHDGKEGNVTSRLVFYGRDTQCPANAISFQCPSGTAFYAVIGFDISYVLRGDSWLISTENVTVINTGMCVPVSLSPDGSVLTCPIYNVPS